MKPKEFINHVLINEIKDIVDRHKYISFLLISVGIEFLGKCMLINQQQWHAIKSVKAFAEGMKLMTEVDSRYGKADLKRGLRDGFAHTFLPGTIALSEMKHGAKNFDVNRFNQTVLSAEEFFNDFVSACRKVIATEFPENDKMNKEFLYVGT